ncbi:helix-turn-helix domain-containing protein [Frisingicoccus caecimuris]|uniref:Excisionase family DNA binding protein n=1 Tax=Frisingicoccus caecimuris TaxID=1796636 RepID=A0A4R2LXQ0_9FIRM|nr:helix-turn-helix domain-containing protein [Frisingicoccus caecimuris]MCR1918457.1 helix-turn-helix domain-containing protein [Frisingicoccus caecimuris]TCO85103.1 excisionase family DNA binding protein [Frisingicoccus caecimuris]
MKKKSMSVREMRRLLGLGKTESYWLVKKNYFDTVIIGGKMRVMIESFENWYANQLHYKKIIGEAPGKNWTSITMSIQETARLLGIAEGTLYDLMKKKPFKTVKVGMYTRIYIDSFEDWYNSQSHYKKVIKNEEVAACLKIASLN